MRKLSVLAGLLVLAALAVALFDVVHAAAVTPPMFRRVRLLNASDAPITRFVVKDKTPPTPVTLVNVGSVGKDGTVTDHYEQPFASALDIKTTTLEVTVTVNVGGQNKTLAPVEIYTGNPAYYFVDLVVVVDDSCTTAGAFEVAVIGAYSNDVTAPNADVVVEAQRTPP